MNKILCVEDNKRVQALNKMEFEERGYSVTTALTLAEAWEAVRRESPGLIILDVNMPDGNGLDFLREFRAASPIYEKIPVLVLTGYGKDADVVIGFESGCNDYMVKPYTFPVLFMRAKELLSRTERLPETIIKGALRLEPFAVRATLGGEDLILTQKEFSILLAFVHNEGTVLSMEQIYEKIWKAPLGSDKRALRRQISNLRTKLKEGRCDYAINTVYGEGYCFGKN